MASEKFNGNSFRYSRFITLFKIVSENFLICQGLRG